MNAFCMYVMIECSYVCECGKKRFVRTLIVCDIVYRPKQNLTYNQMHGSINFKDYFLFRQ